MMGRRQLLERAAKAAGYAITWKTGHCKGGAFEGAFLEGQPWRPLDDDGDALRLAFKLGLTVDFRPWCVCVWQGKKQFPSYGGDQSCSLEHARRAIVRAAAALADER